MKSRVMFMFVLVLGAVLLLLAGCSGVASTPAALAQSVNVTLSDQQISADRSTFTPGQPYHFVVTNTGRVAHQFMMTPRGWDYDHMSMDQRHHVALYMYDQVAPGTTKTFDYTFPTSAVGQSFGFACYEQGSNMWYPFTVQQTVTTPASSQVAHVTLSDQQVSADRSTFYAGMTYHFVVTNSGQVAHQFMMTPRGGDYGHMSMGQRHQMAWYMYDQVAPGETKTFDYTFPASAVGQSLGFACYQQGCCDEGGMWYSFTVQAHP